MHILYAPDTGTKKAKERSQQQRRRHEIEHTTTVCGGAIHLPVRTFRFYPLIHATSQLMVPYVVQSTMASAPQYPLTQSTHVSAKPIRRAKLLSLDFYICV